MSKDNLFDVTSSRSVSQAVTHSFHLLLSLATSLASFHVFHPFVSLSLHTVSLHVFFSLSNLPSPYSTHSTHDFRAKNLRPRLTIINKLQTLDECQAKPVIFFLLISFFFYRCFSSDEFRGPQIS